MFQCALRIVQYGAKRCLTAMQRAGEIGVGAKDGAEAGEAGGKTETSVGAPRAGLDVGDYGGSYIHKYLHLIGS
jgi:hypothetical protein